jgi:hypothetical protein
MFQQEASQTLAETESEKGDFISSGRTVGDRVRVCLSVMSRGRLHSEASNQDVPFGVFEFRTTSAGELRRH